MIVEGEEMDEEGGSRENEVIEWTDNNEFLYYTEEVINYHFLMESFCQMYL